MSNKGKTRKPKKRKSRFFWLNVKILLGRTKWPLLVILMWFGMSFLYYQVSHPEFLFSKKILLTFYLMDPLEDEVLPAFFTVIGTVVITQGILAILINEAYQRANPKLYGRYLAGKMEKHAIIVGYSHLGQRLVEYCQVHNIPYVILEQSEEKVMDLLDDREPVIVGDPTLEDNLKEANVREAVDVFMTENRNRDNLIIAQKVRRLAPNCDIHVRCFDDNLRSIFAKYGVKVFSTSKWTISKIGNSLRRSAGKTLVLGLNNFSIRLMEYFDRCNMEFTLGELDFVDYDREDLRQLRHLLGRKVIPVPLEEVDSTSFVRVFICTEEHASEAIVLCHHLKSHNAKLEIFVRLFDDELADVVSDMGGKAFSTSKFAFEQLQPEIGT